MMQAGRSLPSIWIVIVTLAWKPPSLVSSTLVIVPVPRIFSDVAEIDLDAIEEQRRGWPFLRDRRIDAYGPLYKRLDDA